MTLGCRIRGSLRSWHTYVFLLGALTITLTLFDISHGYCAIMCSPALSSL